LSGKELDGRPLKVNHAHDRPTYTGQSRSDDGDFHGGFRRGGGGRGRR
jgi:hypothetical protein